MIDEEKMRYIWSFGLVPDCKNSHASGGGGSYCVWDMGVVFLLAIFFFSQERISRETVNDKGLLLCIE